MIPAQPAHVALFITELANTARVKGLGFSTLEAEAYGIAWAHKLGGLTESPTDHLLVKMTLDGAKHSLSKPIKPKEPLPLIQDIALRFSSDNALSVIRFLFILLVGYPGFLRADEILKMKVCDVKIHADHMLVSVPERKNDQYRQGHVIPVIRSNKVTCPVCITCRCMVRLPLSDSNNTPLVQRIVKSKSKEYFHPCKSVSYSTIRDEFKKFLGQFVSNVDDFGLHSIKSGAASNPAAGYLTTISLTDMLVGGTLLPKIDTCNILQTIYLKLHNLLEYRLFVSSFYVLFLRWGRKRSCLGPNPDFLPCGVFFWPPGVSLTATFVLIKSVFSSCNSVCI